MTRVLLTLLIGLVVSLGLPNSSFAQYSTDYWEKYSDDVVCSASVRFSKKLNKKVWGDHSGNNQNASRLEAWRRGLNCGVSEPDYQLINKELNTYALERSDYGICFLATKDGGWEVREDWVKYVETAKSRGLSCGVSEEAQTVTASNDLESKSDKWICDIATTEFSKLLYHNSRPAGRTTSLKYSTTSWNYAPWAKLALSEARRRGLSCGVGEASSSTQTASAPKAKPKVPSVAHNGSFDVIAEFGNKFGKYFLSRSGKEVFFTTETGSFQEKIITSVRDTKEIQIFIGMFEKTDNPCRNKHGISYDKWQRVDAKVHTLNDKVGIIFSADQLIEATGAAGDELVTYVKSSKPYAWNCAYQNIRSAMHRGAFEKLIAVIDGDGTSERIAAAQKVKPKVTSAALTAAEKEAERLRQELASLKAEKAKQQQTISSDTKLPMITIASVDTKGKQGIVRGRVKDNTGIAEVTVDGTVIPITSNGNFEYSTFVPSGGLSLKVQATDLAGLTSMMSVTLERNAGTATAAINFDRLNPMGKRVKINKDALALIIGVADYENTPAKAIFADSDAMMFRDYASEKLGIPESRIKTLVNDGADERELLLSVKSWLARASKQDKSDVYVFFAGHGLASDNGEKMYLLPYDGSPELLDDTAILRDRLFSDIASANPRSVTVFLDTCYSGTTRGTDMLIASRPIAIKALEQSIPDNFTVMTAAAGDQTAKPLEEAKHGMFSYFLMKGMEGDADSNQDNQITAGELHQYVQSNVVQQSSGSQTPELQGDAERVLVRFQ